MNTKEEINTIRCASKYCSLKHICRRYVGDNNPNYLIGENVPMYYQTDFNGCSHLVLKEFQGC